MSPLVDVLYYGFPGKASNSFLGWSTIALVKAEGKTILVDTGGSGARPMLIQALSERGLRTSDIDYVFLTHLHFDHIANVNLFPQAHFIFSREEWVYVNTEDDLFVMEGCLPLLRSYEKTLTEGEETKLFSNVSAFLTPGHTPGCLSLVLSHGDEKWIITGDAVKNRSELRTGSVGMTLAAKTSEESIKKIRSMAQRILPGHDCWLRVTDQEAITPETDNEVIIDLPEGMSINGESRVSLKLDR